MCFYVQSLTPSLHCSSVPVYSSGDWAPAHSGTKAIRQGPILRNKARCAKCIRLVAQLHLTSYTSQDVAQQAVDVTDSKLN